MRGRRSGVLCVGNAVVDMTAQTISAYPRRGQEAVVSRIGAHTGGCAVNTAIDLAILGTRTGIVSAVGSDFLGRFLMERLRERGVETSGLTVSRPLPTSVTFVMIWPDGERSFVNASGANDLITDKTVPSSLVKRYGVFHLSALLLMPGLDGMPAARLMKRASSLGRTTALDTCWDPRGRWNLVLKVLPYVDYFLPSFSEAERIFNSASPRAIAGKALSAGVRKAVVVKLGGKGSYAATARGEEYRVPAFRVKAADTTGAGDAFNAGFLAGLDRGLDFEFCLRLGSAAGALCVTGPGGIGSIRSFAELRRMAGKALGRGPRTTERR